MSRKPTGRSTGRPRIAGGATEAITLAVDALHVAALREWAAEELGAATRYAGFVRRAIRRELQENGKIAPGPTQLGLPLPRAAVNVQCPPIGAPRGARLVTVELRRYVSSDRDAARSMQTTEQREAARAMTRALEGKQR